MKDLNRLYQFATILEVVKKIERFKGQYFWKEYPKLSRYESVADHSWRLAILVLLLAPRLSKKINILKSLTMALIHDIPEILAGDASPLGTDGTGKHAYAFDERAKRKRHAEEKRAAKKLFQKLPTKDQKEWLTLWMECEEQKTYEAKIVKSLDKLEALLQILEYRGGYLFKEHLKFNLNYCKKGSEVDAAIENFEKLISKKMKKQFKPFI